MLKKATSPLSGIQGVIEQQYQPTGIYGSYTQDIRMVKENHGQKVQMIKQQYVGRGNFENQ